MQSVKFRSVISPLLFHARARGRRVGQLEAPAGKRGKNAAGAAVVELKESKVSLRSSMTCHTPLTNFTHLLCSRQFYGGWHVISHVYRMASDAKVCTPGHNGSVVSGHYFSEDGHHWHASAVAPFGNTVTLTDNSTQLFSLTATQRDPHGVALSHRGCHARDFALVLQFSGDGAQSF